MFFFLKDMACWQTRNQNGFLFKKKLPSNPSHKHVCRLIISFLIAHDFLWIYREKKYWWHEDRNCSPA